MVRMSEDMASEIQSNEANVRKGRRRRAQVSVAQLICGNVAALTRTNCKMTSEASDEFKRRLIARTTLALVTIALCSSFLAVQVNGQYGGGGGGGSQQYHYDMGEGGGGGGYDYGMDERPKLNLGIRLRIPAFRFELPRFSLPKITVSAKIRQPDRPRVITLPEINLDTTSKVEPPGSKMGGYSGGGGGGGGSYGGGGDYKMSSSDYHQPSYGQQQQQEKSSTFTFSTSEEAHPASYGGGGGGGANNNYQREPQKQYGHTRQPASPMQYAAAQYKQKQKPSNQYGGGMQQQQQKQQQQHHDGYRGATVSRPTYTMYSQPPGGHRFTQTTVHDVVPAAKNPDLGFNSPVHVNPESPSAGYNTQAGLH